MTTETSMPSSPCSARIASDRPTTPNLVAEYVAPPGVPYLPADEATFTRWPCPRAWKRETASFEPRTTPRRLMSTCRAAVSSVSPRKGPMAMIPALFTRTSSGPRRRSTSSRKPANDASLVTSSSRPTASRPIEAAASAARPPSRAPTATLPPQRAGGGGDGDLGARAGAGGGGGATDAAGAARDGGHLSVEGACFAGHDGPDATG